MGRCLQRRLQPSHFPGSQLASCAPSLGRVMSSAAGDSCHKRRHADAHEGASSPRRRRRRRSRLVPKSFQAVRSFTLRTLANGPLERRLDDTTSSARLCRRHRCLSPVPFPALPPLSPRIAPATALHRHRKLHVDDARHAVSTPRRRRSRSSLPPRVRHFLVPGPFALRFLLTTAELAPRRRWKPAEVDMGNHVSQLLRKRTSDRASEARTKRVDGSPEVGDLTVEPELENIDAVSKRFSWNLSALRSSRSPEKVAFVKERLECTKKHGGRVLESGFEKLKLAELPDPLDNTSKEDLSELLTPLSDKDEREVNTLLYNSDESDKVIVIHEPSNIEITKENLQCLRPCGWLNDEVINLYIELLKEREERDPDRFLKCHFFNTFFYKKLTCGIAGYDYQSVRRWTTFKRLGYGLVECEKIFVPVHRNVHWCLVVINMKDKTLQYLDSLGGWGHDVLKVLTRYIMDELKDKSNIEVDPSSWVVVSESLPLQQNGWDCGMFMLKYIDFHSRGIKPCFSQEHMMYFRERTAKEIMTLRAD